MEEVYSTHGIECKIHVYGDTTRCLPVVYVHTFENQGREIWNESCKMQARQHVLVEIDGLDWDNYLAPWPTEQLFKNNPPMRSRRVAATARGRSYPCCRSAVACHASCHCRLLTCRPFCTVVGLQHGHFRGRGCLLGLVLVPRFHQLCASPRFCHTAIVHLFLIGRQGNPSEKSCAQHGRGAHALVVRALQQHGDQHSVSAQQRQPLPAAGMAHSPRHHMGPEAVMMSFFSRFLDAEPARIKTSAFFLSYRG